MKKKILLVTLVAAAVPFFFFSVESDKLRAKIERMAASSGFAVKIRSAGFRLPAAVTLSEVSVEKNGTFLNIPRIDISLSLIRFIAQDPFVAITLKSPSLGIADFSWLPRESPPAGDMPLGLIKIENGSVQYKGAVIRRARGDFSFRHSRVEGLLRADALSGRMVLRVVGKSGDVRAALNADNLILPGAPHGAAPVKLSVKSRIDDDKITSQFRASAGDFKIRGEGRYQGGGYNVSAEWEGLGESSGDGSAEIKGDLSGLAFAIKAPAANIAGTAGFRPDGVTVETSTASIRFVSREISVDGDAALKGFWTSGGRSAASASFRGRADVKGVGGRLRIDAAQKGDIVKVDASLSPSGARAVVSIDMDGFVEGALSDGRKGRASLRGNLSPLDITFSVDDWDASAISSSAVPLTGRFGATGSLTSSGGEWLLSARARAVAAVWEGFPLGNCSASISAGPKMLAVTDASGLGGGIKGHYKSVKGVSTSIAAVASDADMSALSLLARRSIAGRLTGRLEISASGQKPPSGRADLAVKGLALDGRVLGDIKASGSVDGRDISFDKFSLMSPDGSISGGFSVIDSRVKGLFSFGAYAFTGGMRATGQIAVAGKYKTVDDFNLTAESKKWELSGFMAGSAPLFIAAQSDASAYKISELRYGHFQIRDIAAPKAAVGELSGALTLNDYPLSMISSGLKGVLRADGTLYGAMSSPKLKVTYKAEGVEFSTHVPAARISGSGVYSDGVFRLAASKVSQPRAQAVFGGSVSAENIDLAGKITASGISGIVAADGLTSGRLAVDFGVAGRPSAPTVDISGEITDFSYGGASADKLKIAARYDAGRISFSESSLRFGGNEIKILPGSSYDLAAGLYDLKLLAVSLRAGIVSALGRLTLYGKVPSEGTGASGVLTLEDFWIGGKKFKRSELLYEVSDSQIILASPQGKSESFRAEVEFAGDSVTAHVNYTGSAGDSASINLASRAGILSADGNLASLPVDDIASMLDSPLDASGLVNATIKLSGSAENPTVEARAVVYGGSVSGITFDEVSAEATLNDGVLDLVSARAMKANAYRLAAAGRLYVAAGADKTRRRSALLRNDFTVTLEDGRLSFLEAFDFVKKAEGPVTGRMEIRGTLDEPKLTGFLKIENATAELSTYLAKINNLNLIATLKENALTVENFSGRSGSGRFLLQGTARIENFAFADVDFTFRNTTSVGIDLFVPELPIPTQFSKETGAKFASSHSNGKPRFEISIKGDPRSKFTLGGWVKLDHTYFSYPPPPPPPGAEDPARHILEKLDLDLLLQTGENTWYENELVSVNIEGSMALKGNYYAPFVSGAVESKRGYISYIGNEFRIQSARFEVSGVDAYLEGSASKQMATSKGYDTVQVIIDRSLIGRLQPRFLSSDDPSLSSEKVFARIVGVDAENMTPQDRELMLRQGLVRLLDSSLATPFAKTLLRRSGVVDIMKVSYTQPTVSDSEAALHEPSETLPDILRGTKYTFEKYVSDAMLLGYSVTLDEYLNKLDLKHEVEVAYRMKGNVFLRGIYELDSKSLIRPPERKITIEQQWRFGWPKKQ